MIPFFFLGSFKTFAPLLYIQILFLSSFIGLSYYSWHAAKWKKTIFLIITLVSGIILAARWWQEKYDYVIITSTTTLYSGPAHSFTPLGSLDAHEYVRIEEQHNDYYKVSSSRITGWIEKNAFKKI